MSAPVRDGDDAYIARALSAFVRDQVEAPVASLRIRIQDLAETVASAGLEGYGADLARMEGAAEHLVRIVATLLEKQAGSIDSMRTVRHDLRTPLTSILGYGELIAEDARERGDTQIYGPLADALDAASGLLKESDQLLAFVDDPGGRAEAKRPDVLTRAVRAVNQLARHRPGPGSALRGRILIVDDNPSIRDLISRLVSRDGHEVTTCESGRRALTLAGQGTFDLMLLDLMMPGMNGLEVLAAMRANEATRTLPVIMISALDEVDTAVASIEAGADDFLTKPLTDTLLRARIGSSLERKFLRDREEEGRRQLEAEQERSESLLLNVLPAAVVGRLRAGESVIADHLESVTVLFADLVGFTALASTLTATDTLDLLNAIFSAFDRLAAEHGLEKIKTVGDAYMAVAGISDPGSDHVAQAVRMGCRMPGAVVDAIGDRLALRVGIETGPAVAGIIGTSKFFYDVWGDTVNMASRLETSAEPGRVHVSARVRDSLPSGFAFTEREPIALRGKGTLRTFFVDEPAPLTRA